LVSLDIEPKISIIIVNLNGKDNLSDCLQSIKKNEYKKIEIILVDNNSSDESISYVETNFPEVRIIKLEKNYGFAEPNNIGAKKATGEFLFFLNNDTIIQSNTISELVKTFAQDPKIAICQSLLLKTNGDVDSSGDFVNTLGIAFSSKEKITEIKPILSARGAAMMMRTKQFWELGGFDKKYFASFEDVDIGWRAWIWGFKVMLVPNSTVYHKGGQTVSKLNDVIRFHGVKNTMVMNLANLESPLTLNRVLSIFYIILRRKYSVNNSLNSEALVCFPSIQTTIRGLLWVLKNLKYVQNKRNKVNSRRIRTTKQLIELGLIIKNNNDKKIH